MGGTARWRTLEMRGVRGAIEVRGARRGRQEEGGKEGGNKVRTSRWA